MTKDRIAEMIKLMRENSATVDRSKSIPMETSESITSFLEQVQCCRNEIQCMTDQIETLKRHHNQIQRATDENTRKRLENKVEEEKTVITSSIIAIRNNVKSIQEIFAKQKVSPALRRMRDVQINSLVRTVNEITEEYYNCLVDHSEKCKRLLYDMMSLTDEDGADFEELIQKGKVAFFTNNLLLNELEQKINFRSIEDRHADILRVERSIVELKNLTQDLNLVVAIQGEKVEYVERHVQKTATRVVDTARQLKKTRKARNKTIRRKLIISLLCVGFILIIIVAIMFV